MEWTKLFFLVFFFKCNAFIALMAQTNNEARTDRNRAATAQQHKSVHHLPPTYQSMVRGPPVERYNTNIMKIFQAGWRKPVSVAGRTNTTCNNNSKTTMRTTYERARARVRSLKPEACARARSREHRFYSALTHLSGCCSRPHLVLCIFCWVAQQQVLRLDVMGWGGCSFELKTTYSS